MNIKKVDDKPMVIHTKKKATLHIVKKKSKDKPKHKITVCNLFSSCAGCVTTHIVNNLL